MILFHIVIAFISWLFSYYDCFHIVIVFLLWLFSHLRKQLEGDVNKNRSKDNDLLRKEADGSWAWLSEEVLVLKH